jgi:hypothetical protein
MAGRTRQKSTKLLEGDGAEMDCEFEVLIPNPGAYNATTSKSARTAFDSEIASFMLG